MAVIDNTITAADISAAQDIELVESFAGEFDSFSQILGLAEPDMLAAGTALYQMEVTGALGSGQTVEGDEVPLSKYTVKKKIIGELEVHPYRKLTTVQAITKYGYEAAVAKTDQKMIKQTRKAVLGDFFKLLAKGTGEATGENFKAALIQAHAKLNDAMDKVGDAITKPVFFANLLDYAAWASKSDVHNDGSGSVFGLNYIANLAGIEGVIVFSSSVPEKTIYATDSNNLHVKTLDFSSLQDGGLSYRTDAFGFIGVAHEAAYNRASCATNILTGSVMIPEVTNYIIKATIAPGA